jgi:MFS family permease
MKRFGLLVRQNPMWVRIILFSLALMFLRIADGIIAFWAPNQIQKVLGSSFWMGIVISFQSVIGLLSDMFLPSILINVRYKMLLVGAVVLSAITSILLVGTFYFPYVLLFLLAMTIWGVYYELLHFAQFQFMGHSVSPHLRTSGWGIINTFASIAYFLGPLIGAIVLFRGMVVTEFTFIGFLVIGLFLVVTLKVIHTGSPSVSANIHSPLKAFTHWRLLGKVVWPLIITNMLLGFIDSTFWTTGAVWTEKLAKESYWGGFLLPFYQLPPIFMGILVARWGIYKGKKIWAEKFLIVSGIFLLLFAVSSNIYWILLMVLLSSMAVGIGYPLVEGVYTDLVARMGHGKEEMIGLFASTLNVSYIVWPPIAGLLASELGERISFSYLGFVVILASIGLLFVTPKKLRLPQTEIQTWE